MSAIKDFGGISELFKDANRFEDIFYVATDKFPKTANGIVAYVKAIKNAEGATGKFKASFTGLGAAMKANPVGAVIASIVALITVIKIAENAYDKAHDNLDDLSEKGKTISEELSNIRSEIDKVDEQIAELSRQKLSITDSSDISVLNTQIELLEQRKELLEWQEANKKKEEENTANAKIEGTKNNSVYDGASYADWNSGKLSKTKSALNITSGEEPLPTYSAESYVDTLESRLSSIHSVDLQNVVDNLNEIYEIYDEITQNDELFGTEAYNTATEKQKQINELLTKTQYLQAVRNNLDKEYIANIDGNKITNYADYENRLNSLVLKSYSNNGINLEDVNWAFGDSVSKLETELENQGRTLEDYVVWINAAAASQINFLDSVKDASSSGTFKSYSETLNEYKDTLSEIEKKNIDLSKTQFGNIDTNNRQLLEWNDLNLSKYKDALMSWNEGVDWETITKDFRNSTSSILGSRAWGFGTSDTVHLPVAFSPILQTENGAELLSKDTVYTYISNLFNEATKDGEWSKDEILKLDATGLNVDGKFIKGLIADIGSTAADAANKMEYLGNSGGLSSLRVDLDKIIDSMPTVDLAAETESFTKLNAAIKETSAATGLTTESIASLKSRFGALSQYDSNELFENTSNGVRINREEFEKLEHQQEQITKTNLDTKLNALKEKYKLLTAEMDNCNDKNSVTYLSLVQQRNATVDEINAVSELSAQYRGLTSEYQNWIDAQSNGEDGDMYDAIQNGLERTKELFESGLVGTNEFQKYVDLLSGKDLSTASVEEIVAAYKELGNTIKGTSYSATDFLAEGSKGVENALKALQQLNKDWANEENGKWKLNIPIEDAAEKLGISAEYLEAILSKSGDFGLTVHYEDVDFAVEKIENLEEVTEKAAKSLKENQLTDIDFNFGTESIEEVDYQLKNINGVIDGLRDKDGKLNLDSEEVRNAEVILFSLLKRKAELEQPTIMNIDVSTPANDAEYAVKKIQELQSAITELSALNTLNEAGFDVDTSEAEEKVKSLAGEINNLPEETKTSLNLNTTDAQNVLASLSNTDISAGAHINPVDIQTMKDSISSIDTEMIISAGVDASKVEGYQNSEHNASGEVTFDVNTIKSTINMYAWKVPPRKGKVIYEAFGGDNLDGTISGGHNLNGTVNKSGKANVSGDWGAKRTETSLMGEIAPEIWVHSDTGKWELVNYPQFRKVKKGDIIFNGSQTKELLSAGYTNAFGDAFLGGTAYSGEVNGGGKLYSGNPSSNRSKSSKSGNSSSSSKDSDSKEKDSQIIDWIEIAIKRIERAINRLATVATSPFRQLAERLDATNNELSQMSYELSLQQSAYDRYMQQANSVGLSSDLAARVQNGTIDINEYDGDTADRIKDYQEWYEKALDCKDAILELSDSIAELYQNKFDDIATDYENQLSLLEHLTNTYNNGLDNLEEHGYLASTKYYDSLKNVESQNIDILKRELTDLTRQMSEAVNSGSVKEGSEAWYDFQQQINDVKEAIQESETAMVEFSNAIRETKWEHFDYLQEQIGNITEEADFLIDLMENSDLYTDNGQLTDTGMASMGLHGQNYNVYMAQADKYAEELLKLNKEIAEDPNNTKLLERREELLEAQRDSILAAEDEKEAVVDMVREGIELELEALQELIDKYVESLDTAKDLYDYQKNIKEQTSEIASIQKQISAYAGDTSEENRATVQKLQVDLSEAIENLEETQYDHYISEQKKLLDNLYNEYEMILNERLDNIDSLISDMIDTVNANSSSICDTLLSQSDKVGYTITENERAIWSNEGGAFSIVTKYGESFLSQMTSVNDVISKIAIKIGAMVSESDQQASQTINSATPSQATVPTPAPAAPATPTPPAPAEKQVTIGGKINAGSAKIYSNSNGGGRQNQYYKNDPIYTVLDERNGFWKVRYHKLTKGVTGWFRKGDVKAYKTGGLADYTGMAWLDGTASNPEMVLNPKDTKNFIALKDAMRSISDGSSPIADLFNNGENAANILKQLAKIASPYAARGANIGDITYQINIPIDHVQDYEDFMNKMRKDGKFEKFLQSATLDRLVGGSKIAKNKYRW